MPAPRDPYDAATRAASRRRTRRPGTGFARPAERLLERLAAGEGDEKRGGEGVARAEAGPADDRLGRGAHDLRALARDGSLLAELDADDGVARRERMRGFLRLGARHRAGLVGGRQDHVCTGGGLVQFAGRGRRQARRGEIDRGPAPGEARQSGTRAGGRGALEEAEARDEQRVAGERVGNVVRPEPRTGSRGSDDACRNAFAGRDRRAGRQFGSRASSASTPRPASAPAMSSPAGSAPTLPTTTADAPSAAAHAAAFAAEPPARMCTGGVHP